MGPNLLGKVNLPLGIAGKSIMCPVAGKVMEKRWGLGLAMSPELASEAHCHCTCMGQHTPSLDGLHPRLRRAPQDSLWRPVSRAPSKTKEAEPADTKPTTLDLSHQTLIIKQLPIVLKEIKTENTCKRKKTINVIQEMKEKSRFNLSISRKREWGKDDNSHGNTKIFPKLD